VNFLAAPGPRWFTIAAHRPFLEDLAAGLHETLAGRGPQALSEAVILTPTRRAARSLAEAFLRVSGTQAVLLPQIRAVGDLDEGEPPFEPGDLALELPPAISPWRRRFELARLVTENEGLLERSLNATSALELADALAAFLDGCQIEEVTNATDIEALVQGDLARHWQVSAAFLGLALRDWPARLADLGVMDVAERRIALLRRLGERWRERPPAEVIVAAGSTGSVKANADLLAAIAAAPMGCVVLPGLDTSLADAAWANVGEQHPQGALKRLLARAGVGRGDVRDWDPSAEAETRGRWRRRLINEALRPAEDTADWIAQIEALRREGAAVGQDPIAEGLAGLSVIAARSEEEAATAAALLLREALETRGKTAALVTPDANLARRVSARLTRWGVVADSSAGTPLAGQAVAVLASLLARSASDATDGVTLLALLKHPLTRLGLDPDELRTAARALERYALRGPRATSWPALEARLAGAMARGAELAAPSETRAASIAAAQDLLPRIREAVEIVQRPYTGETATPSEAARALVEAMEALAGDAAGRSGDLWSGLAGESLGGVLAALIDESEGLPEVTRKAFSDLLEGLMAAEVVRGGAPAHPRLSILGVLEGRLVRADRLILAALEEGVWPQGAPIDPFLSRPMRDKLGLPPPERRIGLSAHDFAQSAAAPEVVLLWSERRGGAPAVASRWLWRLQTLAKGAGQTLPTRADILAWARALDAPITTPPAGLRTAARPRPKPPLEARPRRMAVTGVERWVRDPYAVYARDILRLRPMERPDEPVEARARGTAVHAAFERFTRDFPDELPDDAEAAFSRLLLEELERAGLPRARMTREHALAANVAPWVVDFERQRRPGARLLIEQTGEMAFDAAGGRFVLTAKADRIEALEDRADILDFKTGAAPSDKQVRAGLSPQLTLTAAILAGGGFGDLGATQPGDLLYVRVSGGRVPGRLELRGAAPESSDLAARALAGLKKRVEAFDAGAPYLSWAAPQFIDRYPGDYDHLARLWEWHVLGDPEETP